METVENPIFLLTLTFFEDDMKQPCTFEHKETEYMCNNEEQGSP